MLRLFLTGLLLSFLPVTAVFAQGAIPQQSVYESDYIQVLEEEDYKDIAEIHKLQEAIPIAEDNCLRIKKDRRVCRCENGYLYTEYDEHVKSLSDRNPSWGRKELKYNFYWEGVTYEDESDLESFRSYSDKYHVLHCDDEQEK